MKNLLFDHLFIIPSIQQFISDIQADLLNGRNVLVLLPPGIPPEEIWLKIRNELWRRDVTYDTISLKSHPNLINPVTVIRGEFSIEWGAQTENHTIDNLSKATGLPEVVFLEGFLEISPSDQKLWIDFLRMWGQKCQLLNTPGTHNAVFCAIEPALNFPYDRVETNVRLAIYWWWGFPSILELQLLCRTVNDLQDWSPAVRWREQLLPSISTSDFSLISMLWDDIYNSSDEIANVLMAYADGLGWEDLNQEFGMDYPINNNPFDQHGSSPPVRLRKLWSRGIIYANREFGIEIHPAALIKMGRKTDLIHRLWRGQAQLLLPVIDNLRLDICKNLTDELGEDWPLKWDQPNSPDDVEIVRSNPLAVQWGYLEHLIRYKQPFRSYRHLVTLISLGCKLRNDIAHYRAVSFKDYKYFLESIHTNPWLSGKNN